MNIFLALGSNIENRYENLQLGIKYLKEHPHIWIINESYVYESPSMYELGQYDFYNMVIEVESNLDPINLLKLVKKIEVLCGRAINHKKNMPRELDIDILTIDNIIIESDILNVPHPKISERIFVLRPWNDIAPNFIIPKLNKTVSNLLKEQKNTDSNLRMILIVDEK